MTKGNIILIVMLVIVLVAFAVFISAPKYQYHGSNYYGGGNVEEQLAFSAGYKTYMQNQY